MTDLALPHTGPITPAMRVEHDFLGDIAVPAERYFGAETMRAIRNFPITGTPISAMPELLVALAWIKKAAARTNAAAGDLTPEQADAIVAACDEILAGRLHEEFCLDVIQGGAGTSTNMNANEVIANRALEIMGHARGDYVRLHPKDHVNKCQSTNDVYATAIRLTVVQINRRLSDATLKIVEAFERKARAFDHIQKLGRTQLQDAVPMTVGQEMQAFADALREDVSRIAEMQSLFMEVNMGGTAIGTAVGVSPYYLDHIVPALAKVTGMPLTPSANRIEASWDTGLFVFYSGLLKRLATKLSKISNDLRLLSSGPLSGIGELKLPQMQPGSSIMPGKVNPVIPEVMNQICFRVFGGDTTVTFAAEAGQLQLNAMEPIIIWTIYDSCTALIAGMNTMVENCIDGITVDEARTAQLLAGSTALVTSLMPHIGYGPAARIAQAMVEDRVSLAEALHIHAPEEAARLRAELQLV
ncbi:MAG: aspartate ammonia-lyase [Sphingopyxis sp.]|uniref:aspartate ammonia-lyase n=1 Tax=Sphingopyxis sp. TaxID=1908224 RepID=UPI002ABA1D54|nr:aspartate ammonia-lyase [Sphingopyxis sp.]MDZ3833290.1 aspartate ammonia-lyase [Sphingopyxis sp.]